MSKLSAEFEKKLSISKPARREQFESDLASVDLKTLTPRMIQQFQDEAADLGLKLEIVTAKVVEMTKENKEEADDDEDSRHERQSTRSQFLQLRGWGTTLLERRWLVRYLEAQQHELRTDDLKNHSINKILLASISKQLRRYHHGNFESPSDFNWNKSVFRNMKATELHETFEKDYKSIYKTFDEFLSDYELRAKIKPKKVVSDGSLET